MDEITIFKALVCVNIITTRHQKDDLEPNTLSPLILSCYIKISEEQIHRLTEGIEQGSDIPLSDEEIDYLMDIESLKDLPENEVRRKGDELENAIKEFQKMQEGYGETGDDDGYDDGDDDYDYEDYGEGPRNNISSIGFFRLIKKGIINLSEIFFGSWYIIGILVLFYILLLEIRRNNNPNNNEDEAEEEKEEEDKKEEKKEDNTNNENNNEDKKTKDEKEEEKIIKEEKKIEEEKLVKEEKIEKDVEKEEVDNDKKEKQD
jgi:hypothetical protein